MTVEQCLRRVDALKPNAFTPEEKTRWLCELEARIRQEVWLCEPLEGQPDRETELTLALPHSQVYILWLVAQIDFANGEYNRYQNTYTMFNWAYSAYVRWFCQNYDPGGINRGLRPLAELTGSDSGTTAVAALAPGDLLTGLYVQVLSPFGEDCTVTVGDGDDPDRFLSAGDIDPAAPGCCAMELFCLSKGKTDITVTVQNAQSGAGHLKIWGRILNKLKGVS